MFNRCDLSVFSIISISYVDKLLHILQLLFAEAQRITDVNNPDNICASRTFSLSFHNFVENCLQSDVKAR